MSQDAADRKPLIVDILEAADKRSWVEYENRGDRRPC